VTKGRLIVLTTMLLALLAAGVSRAQHTDGNFYGVTQNGGAYVDGTVFKITPAGQCPFPGGPIATPRMLTLVPPLASYFAHVPEGRMPALQ